MAAGPAAAAPPQHNPKGRFLGVVKSVRASGRATPQAQAQAQPAAGDLTWHGGPVMHSNRTHAIYWEPSGFSTSASYKSLINGYLGDVAADSGRHSNVYASDVQYTDGNGSAAYSSIFAGSVVVNNAYPASGCTDPGTSVCLTDAQIQAEVNQVVTANGLPRGLGDIYFVMTPQAVGSCFNSSSTTCSYTYYCAYHSSFGSGAGETLYADQPYADVSGCDSGQQPNGGVADSTINLISHEHNETITDPRGDAWFAANGDENGDKCAWNFGTALGSTAGGQYNQLIHGGKYYLQREWSNASHSCVLTMPNSIPTASFTSGPPSPTTGQSVSFDGSASSDSDGTIAGYSWDYGDGATGTGSTSSHTYATAGTYAVKLTVTDNDGSPASVTHNIVVADRPPVAAFTFSPPGPTIGQAVAFDATGSTDPDGTVTAYSWTFGDGGTATVAKPSHTFTSASTFPVTLTVTDNNGKTAQKSANVTVSPGAAPSAAFGFTPASPLTGNAVAFDGSGSSDADGTVTAYAWNFGDGATDTSSGAKPSHTYSHAGTYAVGLTVTDNDGATGSTTHQVTVGDRPPVAAFDSSPASPASGQPVAFDASGSSDVDGTLTGYSWDFGDGTTDTTTGAKPSHTYATPGTWTVKLVVTDDSGSTDATQHDVTVTQSTSSAPPGGGGAPAGSGQTPVGGGLPGAGSPQTSSLGVLPAPGARLVIPPQQLSLSSTRTTGVLVRCGGGRRCAGALTVAVNVPVSLRGGARVRTVVLGKARFSVAALHSVTVRLRLDRFVVTLLTRHTRIRVRATAVVGNAAAGRAAVARSAWLAPAATTRR